MNLHQLLVLDSMSEHPHHQTTLFIESPSEDNGETRMVFFPNSALKILWFDFLKAQTKEAKTQYFKAQVCQVLPLSLLPSCSKGWQIFLLHFPRIRSILEV